MLALNPSWCSNLYLDGTTPAFLLQYARNFSSVYWPQLSSRGLSWYSEGKVITPSAELPACMLGEDAPHCSGTVSAAELWAPRGQGPWIIHSVPALTQCQVQGRWGVFICWKKGDKLYLVFFIVTCDFQRSSSCVRCLQPLNIMPLAFNAFLSIFSLSRSTLNSVTSTAASSINYSLQSPELPPASTGIKWPWDRQSLTFMLPHSEMERKETLS